MTACGLGRSEETSPGSSTGPSVGSSSGSGSSSGGTSGSSSGSSGGASSGSGSSGSSSSGGSTGSSSGNGSSGSSSGSGSSSSSSGSSGSSSGSSSGGSSSGGDGGTDAGEAGLTDAGPGPVIVSLSESPSSITQGGSFTVVAVVTDPNGYYNLANGDVVSASGAVLDTAYPTTPGNYSLTVRWDQLNAAASINFTGQTTATYHAIFYNAQGLHASQDISIELYCGSGASPDAACAGQCVNFTSVQACGSCTASCAGEGGGGWLASLSCEAPGVCAWETPIPTTSPGVTCASECVTGGGTCTAAQLIPIYSPTGTSETCASSVTSLGSSSSVQVATDVITIGCGCDPSGGVFPKNQTGDCASFCATLPGSSPCVFTDVEVMGNASEGSQPLDVHDTCSAPYSVGVGKTWDVLVQANLPASEPVVSPVTMACQCQGPAGP